MTEGILYNECLKEAQTVVQNAKCVAKLLRARDQLYFSNKKDKLNISNNVLQQSTIKQNYISEIDWFTQMSKLLKQLLTNKNEKFNDKLNEVQQSNKKNSQIIIRKLREQKNNKFFFKINKINIKKLYYLIERPYSIQNNTTNNTILFQKNNEILQSKIKLLKKKFKRTIKNNKKSNYFSNKNFNNYKNIEKLKKIIDFCQMLDYCQNYIDKIGESNSKFLFF